MVSVTSTEPLARRVTAEENDVMAAPAAYQQFSGEDIREAFGRYWRPESRYRFVVTPAPAPPGSSPPPAASPRP